MCPQNSKQNDRYSVILQSVLQDEFGRFALSKKLAATLKISQQDAIAKIEEAPCIIATVEGLAEAEKLEQELQTS